MSLIFSSCSVMRSESTPRSKSSTESARSASTVSLPSAETSAKPPSTTMRCCCPLTMTVMMPGRSADTVGAWPASTPKSPSMPGTSTWSTSPENSSFSGETRSKWKVMVISANGEWRIDIAAVIHQSLFATPSSLFACSRRFGGELLALVVRLFDGADHVEGGLGQVVVLAVHQALEALDGVGEVDELAGRAGEHFGDVQRLAQKALDLARARDGELVVFGELVHAEDRDDVLQRLVALQHLLHAPRHRVMLLADDRRRQHARGRIERIDRRIQALRGDIAGQHRGRIEMRQRGRARRIR